MQVQLGWMYPLGALFKLPSCMMVCLLSASTLSLHVVAHTKADKCFDVLGKCVRSSASMKRAKTEDQTHACMVLRVKDPSCPLCDLFAKLFARSL